MLNGEEIQPIISGKSAVFKYSGPEYATSYTFEMPAGVLLSRSDEPVESVTISFHHHGAPAAGTPDSTTPSWHKTFGRLSDPAGSHRRSTRSWAAVCHGSSSSRTAPTRGTSTFLQDKALYMHIIGQNRDKAVITNDAPLLGRCQRRARQHRCHFVTVNSDNCSSRTSPSRTHTDTRSKPDRKHWP